MRIGSDAYEVAELHRVPLQNHFLQQILHYYNNSMGLDSRNPVTAAMMEVSDKWDCKECLTVTKFKHKELTI